MEKNRQPMFINLVDDSLIVLDDDDIDNDMTSSLVMIDDSTVNINDDTLNTTINNHNDDNCDVITIDDDDDEDFMVLPNEKQQQPSEKLNNDEKTLENVEIIEVFNGKRPLKSNIDGKSVENEGLAGFPNKKQIGESSIGGRQVENEKVIEMFSKRQLEKSNIGEKSVENIVIIEVSNRKQIDSENRGIVEIIDKNQPGNSNKTEKSADCVSKTTEVDENSGKGEEAIKGKRKRKRKKDAKCESSEVKEAKLDNNRKTTVLSNTDANLVTDEARNLPETCANKSAVLNGRIAKKRKKGSSRKRRLLQKNRLCEALKSSVQNDASNLAYCYQFLHSPSSCLRELSGGGARKNVEDDKKMSKDDGERNNGEKKGDKKITNDADKEKTKNSEANEKKNESGDKAEDDDLIMITSTESALSSRPSNQSEPANSSINKYIDAGWSRPAHFAPKPVSHDLVQDIVTKLSKNMKLKKMNAAATSSSKKKKRNRGVTESNCAQMSSSYAQMVSNSTQKSSSGSNSGPMLLNVVGNTLSASQDPVVVIDDGDKVFKPRGEPVASAASCNQLSLVGNNMFVPASMPARKGPRPVFIDGCNVAFSHGNNVTFSVKGIEICVDYFRRLGNRTFVVLPNHRKGHLSDATLRAWETDGTLVVTPSRRVDHCLVASDDDRYVIQCAAAMEGIIVTKDQYRDHMGINPIWDETIRKRLLILTWLHDILIFPDDPLGRLGPKLKDFLMY